MKIQKYQSFQWNWTVFIALGIALIGMGASVRGLSDAFNFASLTFSVGGGLMIMVGLIYTLPSSNSLDIEDDGFSYRAGWRRVFCRWDDCGEFSAWNKVVFGMKANELVTFDSKTAPSQSKTNIKATGKNSVLPGTYGFSAQELSEKLNEFRISRLTETRVDNHVNALLR